MGMQVLNNGYFSFTIEGKDLAKGLRESTRNRTNNPRMITCSGVVAREEFLEMLDELQSLINISGGVIGIEVTLGGQSVTFGGQEVTLGGGSPVSYPYPQLFVETNMIILCTPTSVYEYVDGDLTLKYEGNAGSTWSLVAVHDFAFLSNGVVSLVRNPQSKEYEISDAPTGMAICNYNGQIIVGAPNAGYEL